MSSLTSQILCMGQLSELEKRSVEEVCAALVKQLEKDAAASFQQQKSDASGFISGLNESERGRYIERIHGLIKQLGIWELYLDQFSNTPEMRSFLATTTDKHIAQLGSVDDHCTAASRALCSNVAHNFNGG